MENLNYLLRKISLVRDRIALRKSQEEHFNVFTTLMKNHDEVNLHSRFISSILDPKGPHKLDDLFLRHFLTVIESSFNYNLSTIEIHPNSKNWTEHKEIDILIIDWTKQTAIILENKISAPDNNHTDEGQIERYYRRLIEEDHIPADKIEVYYLQLKRNTPPSDDSISKSGKFKELPTKVKLISYEQEISAWLELCIKEAVNSPFLRETLNQYSKLINTMTNKSDKQTTSDIIDTISANIDMFNSAKLLMDNFTDIQFQTIKDFFRDLCSELEKRGYSIEEKYNEQSINNIVSPRKHQYPISISFTDKKGYTYIIGSDPNDQLYMGMKRDQNRGKLKEIRTFITNKKEKIEGVNIVPNEGWEFWCYFDVSEEDIIYFWDFKQSGTFNLIRKENRLKSINTHLNDFEYVISNLFS